MHIELIMIGTDFFQALCTWECFDKYKFESNQLDYLHGYI